MIVISDTTPLISLMKIDQLNLLNYLFGEVQIPSAVFEKVISNPRFPDESRQIRECPFTAQMGIQLMGIIGILLIANNRNLVPKDQVLECIETLKITGRHISDKLYKQLIKKYLFKKRVVFYRQLSFYIQIWQI